MTNISVIIPVYNVANYIVRCAESLLMQDIDSAEYIFVDDVSTDNSIKVLRNFLDHNNTVKRDRVKIISHKKNCGAASARNTGLSAAAGEFVFFCDADDFIESTGLREMYEFAHLNDFDIIWCDYFENYNKICYTRKEPECKDNYDCIRAMMTCSMKYNVWNKLFKRSLFSDNNINFPPNTNMGEDLTTILAFSYAGKTAHLGKAFYHYVRYNTSSLTQKIDLSKLPDIEVNTYTTIQKLAEKCGGRFRIESEHMKLCQKMPLLATNGRNGEYMIWQRLFPEANQFIESQNNVSNRIRFIERAANRGNFLVLKLHYYLIIQLFYKIKYKKRYE